MERATSPQRHALLVGEKSGPQALLATLARSLQQEGVGVTVAENGRIALRSLALRPFDVVLCDIHMARTSGATLLRALREHDARMPVIMLRARKDDGPSPIEAVEQGVYCVEKPVTLEALLRAVMGQLRTTGVHRHGLSTFVAPRHLTGEHVTATVAKNEFGRVLELAMQSGRVVITKHNAPKAVLLSADEYEALSGQKTPETPDLEALHAEFDELLERMQTPQAQAAASALFEMSSSELGAAAVGAARARKVSAPAPE
jgi:antitoxin Phd